MTTTRTNAFRRLTGITFDDAYVVRDLKDYRRDERFLRGHAEPQVNGSLPRMRFQEPPAGGVSATPAAASSTRIEPTRDADGRVKLHADIAHPINSACREVIQSAVIKAFREEKDRPKLPGLRLHLRRFRLRLRAGDCGRGELWSSSKRGCSAAPRGYRTHGLARPAWRPHRRAASGCCTPGEPPRRLRHRHTLKRRITFL